jgi:2-oxo-3-hexenedioate decarboxylase
VAILKGFEVSNWLPGRDMTRGNQAERIDQIAKEALAILGTGRQVAPFSSRYPAFDLAEAYEVASQVRDMRRARGENAIGRKIGFTNRAAWGGYGISGPIWNYMFDSTVRDLTATNETFALRVSRNHASNPRSCSISRACPMQT